MCASYESRFSVRQVVDAFALAGAPLDVSGGLPNLEPQDEVRPTDVAPMIRARDADGETVRTTLTSARFGFLSPSGPGQRKSGPVINFRSEGRTLKNGSRSGRGLVPVSGFFEFTGATYPKTRWVLRGVEEPTLMLACIWRVAEDGTDGFALLTAEPGPDVAPYHTRGVLPLPRAHWADWLFDRKASTDLLIAPPAGTLVASPAPRPVKAG